MKKYVVSDIILGEFLNLVFMFKVADESAESSSRFLEYSILGSSKQ